MAKKQLPEIMNSGIGDITTIMHNQGPISDYSWLAINEEEYRASEALPRQNLDAIPELTAALTYDKDKEGVPSLIPFRSYPIVNANPLEDKGPSIRPSALTAITDRVAAYVMAGLPAKQIQTKLQAEFGFEDLRIAKSTIEEVLRERGILGNVYIDAKHFRRCAQEGPHKKFVARYASRALFVLAKNTCANCIHHKCGRCEVFKKRVVSNIPYNLKTLAHYAPSLVSEKRLASLDKLSFPYSSGEIKKILKLAFSKTPIQFVETPHTIRNYPQPVKPEITERDYEAYRTRQSQQKISKMPGPLCLTVAKRMMLKQVDLAFIRASSDSEIRKLAQEYGVLGYTYLDVDALGTCSDAIGLIISKKLSPDFVVLRNTNDLEGRVKLSKIVPIFSECPKLDKQYFISACERALREGRMTSAQIQAVIKNVPDNVNWASLVAQANLYAPSHKPQIIYSSASRGSLYFGDTNKETSPVDPDKVYKFIAHQMNSGLSGSKLQAVILNRYTIQELQQIPEVGRRLALNEGIQGIYFVDPSIYPDYGRGCIIGSKYFRKQSTAYLLASNACTGCICQTAPSWCSKYCKRIIRQIPDSVIAVARQRKEQARQISTAPVKNPVAEYELVADVPIDLEGSKSKGIDITLPLRSIANE